MAPKTRPDSKNSSLAKRAKPVRANIQPISPLGIVAPPSISVSCEAYEGSLASLFVCVKERKINLLNVPIAPICEAYFLYLLESNDTSLEEAGAALVALAYLLERKAWGLLPTPEPEPEEIEEIVEFASMLPQNSQFQVAIESMALWKEERDRLFFRVNSFDEVIPANINLGDVRLSDLARAFELVMSRAPQTPAPPNIGSRKSLGEVMKEVLASIGYRWQCLGEIIPDSFTKMDKVYWFLAILELIRIGQIALRLRDANIEFSRPQSSK